MALLTPAVATSNDQPRRLPRMSADVTELRLALVCDGGVSLAIYIHGVTKELQHVVTASRAVDHVREGQDGRDHALDGLTASQVAYFEALEASPTPVTVVIDVISGTSAGGINGVCLAKALSGGLSQDSMTSMWLERADLRELTHPHLPGLWGAILSTAVTFPWHLFTQGWAPLDGDRMCRWLLEALGSMDPTPGGPPTASLLPADHTLDLFVTTTDLRGYQKVFPSPDGGKGEHDRNNRKVFHFTSGAPGPDARFGPGDNPGLAFAARCTSSFPGAFAPVDLAGFAAIAARQGIAFDVAAFVDDHLAEYHLVGDDPLTTHVAFVIDAYAATRAQDLVKRDGRRLVRTTPSRGAETAFSGLPVLSCGVSGTRTLVISRPAVHRQRRGADAPSLPGGTLSRYPPPPPTVRHLTTIPILAVLVAAATAMALTACTTAPPESPGSTSTSTSTPVSTPAVSVTPTSDSGAAASASAASAASNRSAVSDAAAESSAAEQATEQSAAEQSAAEQSSPPAVTATAVVNVAAADAAGVPMPGFTVVDDQGSDSPVDCSFGAPNAAAVGVNTHDCSPHAASAHFCWGTTGTVDLVCSWDPRSTELHRYTAMEPLTDTAAAADPVPWALDLADGRKCDVRLGGAFSGRPDDYTVAYVCDGAAETYVLGNGTDPVVDTSGPQWIAKVGGLSDNPTVTSLPPPVAIGVVTAYFAATG